MVSLAEGMLNAPLLRNFGTKIDICSEITRDNEDNSLEGSGDLCDRSRERSLSPVRKRTVFSTQM